jgi:transposase
MILWNGTGDAVFPFVQQLRSHRKRPLRLIWDCFSGHKKAARLLRDISRHQMHVEFLPAYAPELNGIDHAWGHTKYGEMANFIPHNVDDLAQEVANSLISKHGRQDLLKAFFQHARLEL